MLPVTLPAVLWLMRHTSQSNSREYLNLLAYNLRYKGKPHSSHLSLFCQTERSWEANAWPLSAECLTSLQDPADQRRSHVSGRHVSQWISVACCMLMICLLKGSSKVVYLNKSHERSQLWSGGMNFVCSLQSEKMYKTKKERYQAGIP